jgi:hypothetical protein
MTTNPIRPSESMSAPVNGRLSCDSAVGPLGPPGPAGQSGFSGSGHSTGPSGFVPLSRPR